MLPFPSLCSSPARIGQSRGPCESYETDVSIHGGGYRETQDGVASRIVGDRHACWRSGRILLRGMFQEADHAEPLGLAALGAAAPPSSSSPCDAGRCASEPNLSRFMSRRVTGGCYTAPLHTHSAGDPPEAAGPVHLEQGQDGDHDGDVHGDTFHAPLLVGGLDALAGGGGGCGAQGGAGDRCGGPFFCVWRKERCSASTPCWCSRCPPGWPP